MLAAPLHWTMRRSSRRIRPFFVSARPNRVTSDAAKSHARGVSHGWLDAGWFADFARDCRRDECLSSEVSAHGARGNDESLSGGVHLLPARQHRPAEGVHATGAV